MPRDALDDVHFHFQTTVGEPVILGIQTAHSGRVLSVSLGPHPRTLTVAAGLRALADLIDAERKS